MIAAIYARNSTEQIGVAGTPKDAAKVLQADLQRVSTALGRPDRGSGPGRRPAVDPGRIRQHEARRRALMTELETIASRATIAQPDVSVVLPELHRRVRRWRDALSEETAEARQMLQMLMKTRMIFRPNPEEHKVTFEARGHYGQLFAGLITLPTSIGVGVPNPNAPELEGPGINRHWTVRGDTRTAA